MLSRFCLYGFLKNQRYFEPYFMLALLAYDLSFFRIGVLYACRSITLNLLEVPSGALADSWGRRGCMIVSFVAYVASFLLFAMATDWRWFFPAMVLYGIGDSFRTGTHKAMIFEWLRLQGRESERTRVYGITRSWSKFGSATSAVLAAVLVLVTGDYRSIFLFATIPCLLNIINFFGYPRALNGPRHTAESRDSLPAVMAATFDTVRDMLRIPSLRRLTLESMSWEGVLHAIKDYLQPAVALVVLAWSLPAGWPDVRSPEGQSLMPEQGPGVVIAVAAAYTVLFLLSGWASRAAHRLVSASGSESRAAQRLWTLNFCCYAGLVLCDVAGWRILVPLLIIALIVMQNVWRPILVSRFDQHADPARGATVLALESQSQRLATFLLAPLVGWAVDWASQASLPGQFWPIGVTGATAALLILWTRR
jgi:MFS family permease